MRIGQKVNMVAFFTGISLVGVPLLTISHWKLSHLPIKRVRMTILIAAIAWFRSAAPYLAPFALVGTAEHLRQRHFSKSQSWRYGQ
jgi:hypothetical protein